MTEVDQVSDVEAAFEDLGFKDEDSIIVTLKADKGFYIGEKSYPLDDANQLIASLAANKTPDQRVVYLNASKDIEYRTIVRLLDQVRRADIDRVELIVKKKKDADDEFTSEIGVLEVKLPAEPVESDKNLPAKPNPLTLVVSQTKNGQLELNGENIKLEDVSDRLSAIFKERENNGVFREGTNEIEKTVFIKSSLNVRYEDFIRLLDKLKLAGTQPIGVQIDDLSDE